MAGIVAGAGGYGETRGRCAQAHTSIYKNNDLDSSVIIGHFAHTVSCERNFEHLFGLDCPRSLSAGSGGSILSILQTFVCRPHTYLQSSDHQRNIISIKDTKVIFSQDGGRRARSGYSSTSLASDLQTIHLRMARRGHAEL